MKRILYVLFVFVILFIVVLSITHIQNEKNAAQEMYQNFCTALSTYPDLPAPFVSSFCQFEKDGIKYLMIQSRGDTVTGVRLANGETTYCHNDTAYHVSDDQLVETSFEMVDVNGIICSNLSSLILDDTVSYTYHKPSGMELPLWIYPYDPPYLQIKREAYDGYMETVIYSDTEQYEIRWCITKSSAHEDVVLFLVALDETITNSTISIRGWGNVPEDVLKLITVV